LPSESAQYFGEFTVLSDMSQHQISLRFVSLLLVDALTSCNTTFHFCAHAQYKPFKRCTCADQVQCDSRRQQGRRPPIHCHQQPAQVPCGFCFPPTKKYLASTNLYALEQQLHVTCTSKVPTLQKAKSSRSLALQILYVIFSVVYASFDASFEQYLLSHCTFFSLHFDIPVSYFRNTYASLVSVTSTRCCATCAAHSLTLSSHPTRASG